MSKNISCLYGEQTGMPSLTLSEERARDAATHLTTHRTTHRGQSTDGIMVEKLWSIYAAFWQRPLIECFKDSIKTGFDCW